MNPDLKRLTDFLVDLGIEKISHSKKTYLAHLIAVYRFLEAQGCSEEVCRAGMFHSIYGTELFQGFTLPLERRSEVRTLIGERAERLAFLNCIMDRASFDRATEEDKEAYAITNRITGKRYELSRQDFDDLSRVHLYDWLEQVPRSRHGWNYRRAAYRRIAERLGGAAQEAYARTFAAEPASQGSAP